MTRAQSTASHWSLSERHTERDKPRSWTSLKTNTDTQIHSIYQTHWFTLLNSLKRNLVLTCTQLPSLLYWLPAGCSFPSRHLKTQTTSQTNLDIYRTYPQRRPDISYTAHPERAAQRKNRNTALKQSSNILFCVVGRLGSFWQLRGNSSTVEIGLSNWKRQLCKTSENKHTMLETQLRKVLCYIIQDYCCHYTERKTENLSQINV